MTPLEEKVIKLITEHFHVTDPVTLDTTFMDLNADSLDSVEVVIDLEEVFDVILDNENLGFENTCRDVVEALKRRGIKDDGTK